MFVDSHCHLDKLDLTPFNGDLAQALMAANQQGVSHFLSVCVSLKAFPAMMAMTEDMPNVYNSCGVHPLNDDITDAYEELKRLAANPRVVAIGETGLDYYYAKETKAAQLESFEHHIDVATALNKPLIVHTRDAKVDTINLLKTHQASKVGGVLHCFTEDFNMAKQAMDLGFYISISGIVTFKNAQALKQVVKQLPLDRLLIETDSPYLAPIPYRGKSNQPAYVKEVAEYIAKLKDVSVEELAEATSNNFFSLFSLAKP